MNKLLKINKDYAEWIKNLTVNFKYMQIKASVAVNSEMLKFYWILGKGINERLKDSKYGNNFFKTLSDDLKVNIPNVNSFSPTNLRYMQWFYALFQNLLILPQVGAKSNDVKNLPQVGAKSSDYSTNIPNSIVFNIPWGHIKVIIDKYKNNMNEALFYVNKTIENNWSRAVLLNFINTDLYEREGKAITNFKYRLPDIDSDLAQSLTRDPYNFDFLTIRKDFDEKELKDTLLDNIHKFLLELGNGFSFIGKEYRLKVGNTEQVIDLLLYNIKLHCYVVIEVKVTEFKPEMLGQLSTYVVSVDHILKTNSDAKTIGILICKTKDKVLAKYSLEGSSEPIGISEYELSNLLEKKFKSAMPTINEIEKRF